MLHKLLFAIFSTFLFCSASAQADIVVIVNKANTTEKMEISDLEKIFLGKTNNFANGTRAQPVDQARDAAIRESFYQKIAGQSVRQVMGHWSRLVFTGKASAPESLDGDAAVKDWVKAREGAIGYINASALDDSVKSVAKIN